LNGLQADFRQKSLLALVIRESFDLVLAQPPYVPHPPSLPATYLYGGQGDEIAMRLISDLGRVLNPRGAH
jgi:methylase of polypeptide subunit release factors